MKLKEILKLTGLLIFLVFTFSCAKKAPEQKPNIV